MTKVYLMAGRKAWHHDVPEGWTETHWERFDFIECAIFEKPDEALTDEDREWMKYHLEPPEGWISPVSRAEIEAERKRLGIA